MNVRVNRLAQRVGPYKVLKAARGARPAGIYFEALAKGSSIWKVCQLGRWVGFRVRARKAIAIQADAL